LSSKLKWESVMGDWFQSALTEKQWRSFLQRRATGRLRVPEFGNSPYRCPRCGRRLRKFYITKDKETLKRAEKEPEVERLITGYSCHICGRTYFPEELGLEEVQV